jgi:hypothetical protein
MLVHRGGVLFDRTGEPGDGDRVRLDRGRVRAGDAGRGGGSAAPSTVEMRDSSA